MWDAKVVYLEHWEWVSVLFDSYLDF
jgi:hypothetical protein